MATPVPPPSPRHLRLLRLLLSGLVLGAALRGAAAGRSDAAACPGSLDCALQRRARCATGAHVCGPCLQPFQEDRQGLCVPRTRQPLAATLGLSERGQGLDLGLPSTRGAPAPTPRPSLGPAVSSGPVHMSPLEPRGGRGDGLTLVLILACSVAGAAALLVAALFWWRLQRDIRLTQKADYAAPQAPSSPAPPGISPGDQRLAHSAEMYHYQHQRQQMRCLERHKEPPKELDSASSDEENEDGDFTVYECPGLAPTGEMEVRNPLFDHASLSAPPLQ
ncbi:neural proliferation differentiation and control protein 1 isoform X2 [Moschus berezovskii]|uniref:neural proliferation differentiation and control protein 1 isoform X2 n=1 Tax=Moschus berezovskii TaxID=68408 RepID=UPI002443B9F9|nr:neural proliferation differentiation and control protein 1 isoform X2 [Moschus berezovskii]